jgi:hypothetical protein
MEFQRVQRCAGNAGEVFLSEIPQAGGGAVSGDFVHRFHFRPGDRAVGVKFIAAVGETALGPAMRRGPTGAVIENIFRGEHPTAFAAAEEHGAQ